MSKKYILIFYLIEFKINFKFGDYTAPYITRGFVPLFTGMAEIGK